MLARVGNSDVCTLRLYHDYNGVRGSKQADVQFRVSNRLQADAELAHTEMASPQPRDFRTPEEFTPEERALYDVCARTYIATFPEKARVIDIGFSTELLERGVVLVGSFGLLVEVHKGPRELRLLRTGGPGLDVPLAHNPTIRFALLRSGPWQIRETARVVVANLLEAKPTEEIIEPARLELDTWLDEQHNAVKQLVQKPVARPGITCRNCVVIPKCPALK